MQATQLVAKKQEISFTINFVQKIALDFRNNDSLWIKIKDISVYIKFGDKAVFVDIYLLDGEDSESLTRNCLAYNEVEKDITYSVKLYKSQKDCDKLNLIYLEKYL